MAANSQGNDAMIRRFERELQERNSAAQAIISNAQDDNRDLNDAEKETLGGLRERMGQLRSQLTELEATAEIAQEVGDRMRRFDQVITEVRRTASAEQVEYRSAGAWMLDVIAAASGNTAARERMEVYERIAAHQKTGDNLGVVPDPIVGNVINFIDAARPIVSFIGPMGMPSATWHRPKVGTRTAVAKQGEDGAAADEKLELVSQRMTITRLNANAVTYGGYVNVSRQNVDFSSPNALDLVINDLAGQYSIETEAATAAELAGTNAAPVEYELNNDSVAGAVWAAAAQVYAATKGQGRLGIAVAPDRLRVFGPLFAPVNPQNSQSTGFTASGFGQGIMGNISGIPVMMSAGLGPGEAFMFSTAAIEVFEQRVGALQAIEPSVLGTQVAYAGYFTPLTIEQAGIVPLTGGIS